MLAGIDVLYVSLGSLVVTAAVLYGIQKLQASPSVVLTGSQVLMVGAIAGISTAIGAFLLKLMKLE